MGVQVIAYSNSHSVLPRLKTAMAALVLIMSGLGGIAEHVRGGEAMEQIRFPHGASDAEVTGGVIRGERALYMFGCACGPNCVTANLGT